MSTVLPNPETPTSASPSRPPAYSPESILTFLLGTLLLGLAIYGWLRSQRPAPTMADRVGVTYYRLNVNQAEEVELRQLPGISRIRAKQIRNHIEKNGPVEFLDDLEEIHGIGPKTIAGLKPHAAPTLRAADERTPASAKKSPPVTILDLNTATVAELMQLPGIGPVLAERIVQARNLRPFVSVDDLKRVNGIGVKKVEAIRGMAKAGS